MRKFEKTLQSTHGLGSTRYVLFSCGGSLLSWCT